jgi:hypothetical protein
MMGDHEKRLDTLEAERVEQAGEDIVISCVEHGEKFNEHGERVPVEKEPIGWDEGCWRPTRKGRMRVRWAIYEDRRMLRDCDRAEQGLPPISDHGVIRNEPTTGD